MTRDQYNLAVYLVNQDKCLSEIGDELGLSIRDLQPIATAINTEVMRQQQSNERPDKPIRLPYITSPTKADAATTGAHPMRSGILAAAVLASTFLGGIAAHAQCYQPSSLTVVADSKTLVRVDALPGDTIVDIVNPAVLPPWQVRLLGNAVFLTPFPDAKPGTENQTVIHVVVVNEKTGRHRGVAIALHAIAADLSGSSLPSMPIPADGCAEGS